MPKLASSAESRYAWSDGTLGSAFVRLGYCPWFAPGDENSILGVIGKIIGLEEEGSVGDNRMGRRT